MNHHLQPLASDEHGPRSWNLCQRVPSDMLGTTLSEGQVGLNYITRIVLPRLTSYGPWTCKYDVDGDSTLYCTTISP